MYDAKGTETTAIANKTRIKDSLLTILNLNIKYSITTNKTKYSNNVMVNQ